MLTKHHVDKAPHSAQPVHFVAQPLRTQLQYNMQVTHTPKQPLEQALTACETTTAHASAT